MILLIYTIACYSLTFGLIESPNSIICDFRKLVKKMISEKLITCYHCAGFWVSLILSPFVIIKLDLSFWFAFLLALYGGGTTYLLHLFEDVLIARGKY